MAARPARGPQALRKGAVQARSTGALGALCLEGVGSSRYCARGVSSSVRFWGRAVEHAGGVLGSGLEFFDWLAASSSPPPPPLVVSLSSGCLLSFSCPRLGVAGWTLERSVSALSAPLGSALASRCALPCPSNFSQASQTFLGRAPARARRSVYLLAVRSGRTRQVFGRHFTDALWNALAVQFEERSSRLAWRARFCIRV